MVIKELIDVLLVSNNHIINIKGHGQLWGGGFIFQVFTCFPELLVVKPTEKELLLYVTNFGLPDSLSALLCQPEYAYAEPFAKCHSSVFDRRDQADSIPFYRDQFMKEGLLIKVV